MIIFHEINDTNCLLFAVVLEVYPAVNSLTFVLSNIDYMNRSCTGVIMHSSHLENERSLLSIETCKVSWTANIFSVM
jgi:hypothetical protein